MAQKCNKCGGDRFSEAMLGSGHANAKDIGQNLSFGKRVLLTYCLDCGEVLSLRVDIKK